MPLYDLSKNVKVMYLPREGEKITGIIENLLIHKQGFVRPTNQLYGGSEGAGQCDGWHSHSNGQSDDESCQKLGETTLHYTPVLTVQP